MQEQCLSHLSGSIYAPSMKCVYGAIRRSKWSAPGPDGLAAGIWARFAPCVSSAFFEAATFICNGGAAPPNPNASLAVYIPQTGLSTGTHGLQARASEARPLALKDAAAKIIWRVLARSLMPALQEWARFSQMGFHQRENPRPRCYRHRHISPHRLCASSTWSAWPL